MNEFEKLALYATRYLWLRDKTTGKDGEPACFNDTGYGEGYPRLEGELLDEAIDAAMAMGKDTYSGEPIIERNPPNTDAAVPAPNTDPQF